MCGIIAINTPGRKEIPIEQALNAIKHRGPDDMGFYFSDSYDAQLGHVRLSILDVTSAGHQPMEDSSGRYIISYNGEIYNFGKLKSELSLTYGPINWKSNSDTEVILEGFARDGFKFLGKLNGIFALAIYDKVERNLHVLRDPIGIKPLYFTQQYDGVYFCSELKGLLAIPGLKMTLRHQSLADQLAFMYVPEPYTMYEEFYKLESGLYCVYKDGKLISQEKLFNSLYSKISFTSESEMIDVFRETFSESVKRQLISDVPIALFLSGGLDSSSIAYEAIKGGANIKSAYTISSSIADNKYDGQSDDLYYAKLVAKKFGLTLEVIQTESNFLNMLPDVIHFMEDGISDPAAINTFLICKGARNDGVKVMLSGQGADEYLCGYRRYQAEKIIKDMSFISKNALFFADFLTPKSIPGKLNATARRLKRLALAARQNSSDRLSGYFMWNSPENIRNLFNENMHINPGQDLKSFFVDHKEMDQVEAMLLADQRFDLLALNLAYNDKMSMACGIEARVPFLDFEMIQLMNSIPIDMKLKGNTSKYILKKAMEPYLPKEVVYRSKAGFSMPIRAWLRVENEMTRKYFDSERINKQGILNSKAVNQLLNEHYSGKNENSYTIFALLCQQIWLEKTLGY
jgi:asparagine synthase (glutamine-hydrolysing)